MKKLTVLTGLILAAWVGASVCNQTYHLQDATQFMLTGSALATLKQQGAAVHVDKGMNAATLLNDSTEYRMITDWDGTGTCDAWVKKEVKFAKRKRGESKFAVEATSDYSVKINDGEFQFKKPGWDEYWFGFASSVSGTSISLYEAIGKFKAKSKLDMWYGNATMKRTIRSGTGAITGTFTHYYSELTSFPDSAELSATLLNQWKDSVNTDTRNVDFTVQLIHITYDSMETPITRIASVKPKASGFQVSQTGNLVLIQPGEKAANSSEPLSLYGMMGNKIATLHPTGYLYQWNGRTASGAEAPTGVYFVQSGARILGKFFYSR
ncbi:MAG: hypothetical protein JWO30_3397 [Fibrobacteres bacterium]|nr:hypothetical protein [Fibrobacterota bacterium]